MTEQLLLPPEGASPRSAQGGVTKWANFDPGAAKRALELVALGKSLFEIEQDESLPPAETFIQWVMVYPDMARAYTMARELSGYMLEEEALFLARYVKNNPPSTAIGLKSYELLINQLKWAAGKRNPQVFSDKAALNVTVPIQINTSLDLGSEQKSGTKEFPNIYDMSASLEQAVPLDEVPIDAVERGFAKSGGGEEGRPAGEGGQGRAKEDRFSEAAREARAKRRAEQGEASHRSRTAKARANARRARETAEDVRSAAGLEGSSEGAGGEVGPEAQSDGEAK